MDDLDKPSNGCHHHKHSMKRCNDPLSPPGQSALVDDRPTRDIRLGTLGHIRTGVDAGRVVEVIDDWSNTGGFLICTYADLNRSPEVFDSWVETIIDVDMYFDEAGWEIEWIDSGSDVADDA